jgi:DHA1 family multidrug resistance protein-like MFS transporter
MIAPPWWGRAGERFGVERILTVCFLLSGSVAILQFTVHALWLFVAVQFLFGLFVAGIASSASIMIVRSSSTTFQGRAFGLTASADQLGAMFGALLGGMIGGLFQTQWIFLAAGVLLILSGLLLPKRTAQTKIAS